MLIFLDYYASNQFQFHKGSIKTMYDSLTEAPKVISIP